MACHDAQADFVAKLEVMAGDVLISKEALAVLKSHPMTKKEWNPEHEKNNIKIEFSFTREDREVIDADFKTIEDVKQIEN